MNRRTGIMLALLFAIVILIALTIAGWAKAAPERTTGICELFSWTSDEISVIWHNAPVGISDATAIFYLNNLDTGNLFLTGTSDWVWYGPDVYLTLDYNFSGRWKMTNLYCVARYPSGYYEVSPTLPGPWFGTFPYQTYLPLVER